MSRSSTTKVTTGSFCGRHLVFDSSSYSEFYSEVDYPPKLIEEGLKSVIYEINKAIRSLNAKLGLQSPKVSF